MIAREESIDELGDGSRTISLGRLDELVHFGGRGRKPEDVEIDATAENGVRGRRRKVQRVERKPLRDERIDRIDRPLSGRTNGAIV